MGEKAVNTDDHLKMLNAITDQLLAIFPIGSQWYDAGQDDILTVIGHVRPLGIVLTPDNRPGEGTRIGHAELLQGRLIPTGDGEYSRKRFMDYPEEARRAQSEYKTIINGLKMWA